jgi:hypothetical protein
MERIESARRQALDAYRRAHACIDTRTRDEWLKAAAWWEELVRECERSMRAVETELAE